MSLSKKNPFVFALDIGTRSVIGVLAYKEKGKLKILDAAYAEHEMRAMYDGQIHDIDEVSRVIGNIKQELEERNQLMLKEASVAAAGRALQTETIHYERQISGEIEISNDIIQNLEIEAVQQHQQEKKTDNISEIQYYYVGHSVSAYYLDDLKIDALKGHRAKKIGVDLIATFLPETVVNSLYTCLDRAGLTIGHMTLEPIAAMAFAVPKDIRLLNLALVDIGAGTSDIAITKEGSVVAYDMVDIAGDEVTEVIAHKLLLGFKNADFLKRQMNEAEPISYTNILGITEKISADELKAHVQEVVERLANRIAEQIKKINGKEPSAIFLVGGGAQIPGLSECVATALNMPLQRVVVRSASDFEEIEGMKPFLRGPQGITPLGIALTTNLETDQKIIEITLNGAKKTFLNIKKYRIADVLIEIGFNPRKLIPKMSNKLSFEVNGQSYQLMGSLGEPASIQANGETVGLDYEIKTKDVIEIKDAVPGKLPEVTIAKYMDSKAWIYLNGEIYACLKKVQKNNQTVTDYQVHIEEGDCIHFSYIRQADELQEKLGTEALIKDRNGKVLAPESPIVYGEAYFYGEPSEEEAVSIDIDEIYHVAQKTFENKEILLKINGETKKITYTSEPFIFVHVFDHIDFDLTQTKGRLMLEVNGNPAEYQQILKDGDELSIYWVKGERK